MKTNRLILRFSRNVLIGVGLALGATLSLDAQTVIAGGGNAITGGNFYLGTHASSPSGLLLTYDDALTNGVVVKFHANQLAAWLWENGTGTASPTTWPSMKLDLSNNLILYNGNNEGVRLDPVNSKLTLGGSGGAFLAASGSALTTSGALTVGGTLTAQSSIINNGTLTGGSMGLTLSAGGSNQNVTLTPSGTGNVILLPPRQLDMWESERQLLATDSMSETAVMSKLRPWRQEAETIIELSLELTPTKHMCRNYIQPMQNRSLSRLTAKSCVLEPTVTWVSGLQVRAKNSPFWV